jgi:hypothetical protein
MDKEQGTNQPAVMTPVMTPPAIPIANTISARVLVVF